jgi:hypothetical protein
MCNVFDEVEFGFIVNHITIACRDSCGPASAVCVDELNVEIRLCFSTCK